MKVSEYKKLVKPRESDIQNECIAYLESRNYYVQRLNAGGYKMAGGFVHGVKGGTPDLMAFKCQDAFCNAPIGDCDIDLVFVEVKRPGGIVSELQVPKIKELENYGARCLIVHSLEELGDLL
jgi:hypothetical protein